MRLYFASVLKKVNLERFLRNSVEKSYGKGLCSFQMEFCQNIQDFFVSKNILRLEVIAMLVGFPTIVHKLRSDEDIPSFGHFSEKGSKNK